MTVLCRLKGADGDAASRVALVAGAADVRLIEDIERFSDEVERDPFLEFELLLQAKVERAEWTEEVDVCRDVLKDASGEAGKRRRANGKGIPFIDHCIQLIAVFDFATEGVARDEREARAAGPVNGSARQEGVGGHARSEGVDRREGDLPRKLHFSVERDAVELVGDGVSLLELRLVDSFDEIDLLVGVAIGELVVVGVVERFGKACN